MIGTCDCCQAENVELSRGELAGLETWSCYEGCKPPAVLAFHDALTTAGIEYAGLSWSGFNLFGDRKSVDEAKRNLHAAQVLPVIQQQLANTRPEIDQLKREIAILKGQLQASDERAERWRETALAEMKPAGA